MLERFGLGWWCWELVDGEGVRFGSGLNLNVGRFCIGIIWEGIRCSKPGSVSARRLASSILSESGWSISMFAILCAN